MGYPPHGPPPQRPGPPAWVVPTAIGAVVGIVLAAGGYLLLSGGDDDDPVDTETASEESDAETGATTTEPTTEPTAEPGSTLTGTWEGTYECAQGTTGLKLSVVDPGEGVLDAAFEFAPVAENPGVPSGGYWMTGSLAGETLSLDGSAWFADPGGYEMVGLEAEVADPTDGELTGTVVGGGCTDFTLERTSEEPWYAGEWTGRYTCGQGLTGITLTVTPTGTDTVDAVYEFYEVAENPGVPSGSYSLTGTYSDRSLTFEPDAWIDRPTGYVMVGITGNPEVVVAPTVLAGRVDDSSCEAFLLFREGQAPAGSGSTG